MKSPDSIIQSAPSKKEKIKSFYDFIIKELPDGLPGEENQFPVSVDNQNFNAVIIRVFAKVIWIGLFVDGGKYSRLTIQIDKDGNISEDKVGIIPEFDLTEKEPDFSVVNLDEIAFSVISQIQNYKRDKTH